MLTVADGVGCGMAGAGEARHSRRQDTEARGASRGEEHRTYEAQPEVKDERRTQYKALFHCRQTSFRLASR